MQKLPALVISAQRGDFQAFRTLVRRFQDMAFATAFAMLGNAQLAEDVAQEAFLEAYINLTNLEMPAAFPGWFHTIVVRQASRLTRRKSLRTLPIDSVSDVLTTDLDLPSLMVRREVQERVQNAIDTLTENERQVILLFYINDYSQREIAAYLNVPVSTVKSRLHTARAHLRERMIQMVQDNLQQQRPSQDQRFLQEVTDVIEATKQGDLSKLNQLLERNPMLAKAKDERPGAAKATALHYAAWSGHKEIAELLLSYGADIDLHDELYDAPPIGWAGENGQQQMFTFFLKKGAKLKISQAAAYAELSLVQSMIEQDPALVNFGTEDPSEGWSPLWQAALWRLKETVGYLLVKGADVNATTRRGETALHGAVMGGEKSIIEQLLLRGADINAQANNGMTALHRAAWQRSVDAVTLLLAHGADTQSKDNNGYTPFQLATAEEGTTVDGWGEALVPVAEIVGLLQGERTEVENESIGSDRALI